MEARLPSVSLVLAFLLFGPLAAAQQHAKSTMYVRAEGDDVKVAIEIKLDFGWHIYHGPTREDMGPPEAIGTPTTIEMEGEGFEWSTARFPEPMKEEQDFGSTKTWILEHIGTPVVYLRGRKSAAADLAALKAKIKGLTCTESCVPYAETVTNQGRGSDKLFAKFPADLVIPVAKEGSSAQPGKEPAPSDDEQPTSSAPADPVEVPADAGAVAAAPVPQGDGNGAASTGGAAGSSPQVAPDWSEDDRETGDVADLPLLAFLLTAIGWGLFSLLMPCTYPMIPITISYFTKQAATRKTSLLPLALLYGAGIVLIYILIGVAFGPLIIPFAANPWFNLVVGAAFIFFALSLFGAILLQPPQFMMGWVGQATRKGGYLGVFLLGALLVVTSFTCTAPFVGSLLATAAKGGRLDRVVIGMGTFGLTMAIPFVFLGLAPGKIKQLPKSGEWMHTLKVTLGFVEIAAALKFVSNADLVWQWNIFSRELFLMLWGGTFLLAALYLLGLLKLKEDVEPGAEVPHGVSGGRLSIGIAFLLFGLYSFHGALGNELDWVMKGLAPPYSTRIDYAAKPETVVDDFDAAIVRAKGQGKLVLINFTGFV